MTTATVSQKLKSFSGGVHPADDGKAMSRDCAIEPAPDPDEVIIFLSQHIGAPCQAVVKKGDEVQRGQLIGEAQGFVSAPIHASVSGKVIAVQPRHHPIQGKLAPAVVIERTGDIDRAGETGEKADLGALTPDQIKERIFEAGMVGMGGATFPTHVKLSPPDDKPIDVLPLHAAAC